MCGEPHPTSVCVYLSNSESSDHEIHNPEVNSEDSISSGCHTDSNSENLDL